MKSITFTPCFLLLLAGSVGAQEISHFTFDAGAGFTQTVGATGKSLDNGWNVGGGAGWNFTPYLGAMVQTNYNSLGVNSATLNNLGLPGGNIHVFSATIEPLFRFHAHGRWDPYVIGGGGLYHEQENLIAPSGGGGFLTGNSLLGFTAGLGVPGSYSVNKPGANIGAGIDFSTPWRAKIYAEARWNHVYGSNGEHLDYVPVTFGVRW